MKMIREITFITSNENKVREIQEILSTEDDEISIRIRSQALSLPEIQGSIEEISREKCRVAATLVKGPVLVEDTALSFDALNGLPGPYVKWFLSAIGLDGLNNLLAAYSNKKAQAICTFAYLESPGQEEEEEILLFQGVTDGVIVPARGRNNFGWDPIFEHDEKTYAEMTPSEKNSVSHRGKALKRFRDWIFATSSSS